jgi:hypothetical protein
MVMILGAKGQTRNFPLLLEHKESSRVLPVSPSNKWLYHKYDSTSKDNQHYYIISPIKLQAPQVGAPGISPEPPGFHGYCQLLGF